MDEKSKFTKVLTSLKHYTKYKVEIIILLISFVFVICSLIASMIADKDTMVWFARSGSIMVLLSVIVEYRLHNQTIHSISRKVIASVASKAKVSLTNTKQHNNISIAAHTLVVLGTLIWGYGDMGICLLD